MYIGEIDRTMIDIPARNARTVDYLRDIEVRFQLYCGLPIESVIRWLRGQASFQSHNNYSVGDATKKLQRNFLFSDNHNARQSRILSLSPTNRCIIICTHVQLSTWTCRPIVTSPLCNKKKFPKEKIYQVSTVTYMYI